MSSETSSPAPSDPADVVAYDAADLARQSSFEEISRELLHTAGEQPTLERITELAVATIDGCDACGVSIRRSDGSVDTPACTSALVEQSDALQYQLGEGPCLDAIWKMDMYLIDDLATETRWPQWAPAAVDLGFAAILSLRLETPEHTLGGLNLYSHTRAAFDNTDVMIASIFARHASNALSITRRHDGLQDALRTRQVIGIAQGMLMQRYGLTLDQSFEVLHRYSNDNNVRLRVVAEQLVAAGRVTSGIQDAIATPPATTESGRPSSD